MESSQEKEEEILTWKNVSLVLLILLLFAIIT